MSNSKILVSGATGTNGRALIDTLLSRDVPVRALVRNIDSARATLPGSIELMQGDLSAPDSLSAAFDGIDKAYVVTAVQPNTVALFRNFYDAARDAGVSHVVKFSGMGAEVDSPSEVIRQHATSDADLRASRLPYTILRPNSFHQNMLWQAGGIATTGKFYLPLGDAAQSTIDVRDIADISSTILTTDGHIGKTYDLTGPESLSFHDVARIIADVRGAPVEYVPITQEAAEHEMRDQGMPEWSAHSLAEIQALFATGQYAQVTEDSQRLLGRTPRSFRDFATDHKDAFMA
ncbi:SDR family oxidoreductase [Ruegeria sp. R13_0]|uniref:SDR family oxidoreductase n=1 Tax=Ruegeria sp. R13_0 TaxID=2821099 RepID=UPI001AD97D0B|nr:SDR family oxidoreductase [Ruegeria sp. R13_0]MBO9436940.1 SDR family oxidoreductase [Ruegeria sp. R13_0]